MFRAYLILLLVLESFLGPLVRAQGSDSLKIVDYHVHFFSPALMDNLTTQGFDFKKSGFQVLKDKEDYSSISEVLADNQCHKMVLISVGYAYKNLNESISEQEFVVKENNLLANLVDSNPEKVIGFYGINPLSDFAIEEILRCDEELKLSGIKLHLQGNQVDLKDSIHLSKLKSVFRIAQQKSIPVLMHNNAHDNAFGNEYFQIFKEEILDKFENLTIVFAHGGGGGGFFNFTYDFLKAFENYWNSGNSKNEHNFYFELSGVVKRIQYPGARSHKELLNVMTDIGYDRFLFGSDYPVRKSPTYLKEIQALLEIEPSDLKKIVERDIFK